MAETSWKPRFSVLLASMIVELMLAPVFDATVGGFHLAEIVTSIVLLAALRAIGVRPLTLVLFLPALAMQIVTSYARTPIILSISALAHLLFLTYVLYRLVQHVLRIPRASLDTVAGAGCGYMILALIWCDLYLLVQHWRPGSFVMPVGWDSPHDLRATFVYFSFATLSTATYGEIHPINPRMGALCVAEAVTGQLYLAVMIARLVGLHVAGRRS